MRSLLILLGGGLGALARVETTAWLRLHGARRWSTRIVNILGTTVLAIAVVTLDGGGPTWLTTGFLGGFTTFSTWMLEAGEQRGRALVVELVVPFVLSASVAGLILGAGH